MEMKSFFKRKRKFLVIFSLAVLVVGLLSGIILVKQNQNIIGEAAINSSVWGCKNANKARECAHTCSLPKGKNKTLYACRWGKGGCKETSKTCRVRTTAQVCPSNMVDCVSDTATKPKSSFTCRQKNTGKYEYCCLPSMHLDTDTNSCVFDR